MLIFLVTWFFQLTFWSGLFFRSLTEGLQKGHFEEQGCTDQSVVLDPQVNSSHTKTRSAAIVPSSCLVQKGFFGPVLLLSLEVETRPMFHLATQKRVDAQIRPSVNFQSFYPILISLPGPSKVPINNRCWYPFSKVL